MWEPEAYHARSGSTVESYSRFPRNDNNEASSVRRVQDSQQGAHQHERFIFTSATGGWYPIGDYTQREMASTMEAYRRSDPTQAEDGYFSNPSEPSILTGAASTSIVVFDDEDLAAFEFPPGFDIFANPVDYGNGFEGNELGEEQQLSVEAQPGEETQLGEGEKPDLEADLGEVLDELFPLEEELDDGLDDLFSPEGDDNGLFLPDTVPFQTHDKAHLSQNDSATITQGTKVISKAIEQQNGIAPALFANCKLNLPTLPATTLNNGPPPAFGQYQPGKAQSQLILPVAPTVIEDNRTPPAPTQKPTRAKRRLAVSDSLPQVSPTENQFFSRSFNPDTPIGPPARKKSKVPGLPAAAELPALFQMDKLNFREFEYAAKTYMLDLNHPQRLIDGSGNLVYRQDSTARVAKVNEYALHILENGAGEQYYGVKSAGYATRSLKWPENKPEIIELLVLLLRKICKNETQRRYAQDKRDRLAAENEAKDSEVRSYRRGSQISDSGEDDYRSASLDDSQSSQRSGSIQSSTQASEHQPIPKTSRNFQYHINFVMHDRKSVCVRPKIIMNAVDSRGYMHMVNFIVRHLPDKCFLRCIMVHCPDGLKKVEDQQNWVTMIKSIRKTDWMERDIRCVAELEPWTREVITID